MGKKIKVIIVDSGVLCTHPLLENEFIQGIQITEHGITENFQDEYGHGTAIYQIISSAKLPVELFNIKIMGIEQGIDEEVLIAALKYIEENIEADIINLSLGISIVEHYKELEDICERLNKKGVIIVSAFDNTGAYSFPAAFRNVIGVTTGELCYRKDDFEYFEDSIVNVAAMGNVQKLAWVEPTYIMSGGNSFACAHVTVQCIKYMLQGANNREVILERFRQEAKRIFTVNQTREKKHMKIGKAAIFPFNKEMHSLVRFSRLLDFEITNVYDTKYSGIIGSDTIHILKDEKVLKKEIRCINDIEWESFDTLILGHTDSIGQQLGDENLRDDLVRECLKHRKQVYSFDEICKARIAKEMDPEEVKIEYPEVLPSDVPANPQGKLYRIGKPVFGVFGTSSKQGKFTLQLTLREKLMQRGFKVGQIGTEPSAVLYGMDEVYPMGYNGNVKLHDLDAIRYLNGKMYELCKKDCDIILVGSQSGTVPYDVGNIGQYNISQYLFLQGTLPDAAVLCINTYDEPEHIIRTINFLKAATETEVIGLVVFPMQLRNETLGVYGGMKPVEEAFYNQIKMEYVKLLHLPVFRLGELEDMEQVIDLIIAYFNPA